MKNNTFGNVPIPDAARTSFKALEGIPLEVISELFARMDMPEENQKKFWGQVTKKKFSILKGCKVAGIITRTNGSTEVLVDNPNGLGQIFTHPGDITDAQLKEFTEARTHNLTVDVGYQSEGLQHPVNFLAVYNPTIVPTQQPQWF